LVDLVSDTEETTKNDKDPNSEAEPATQNNEVSDAERPMKIRSLRMKKYQLWMKKEKVSQSDFEIKYLSRGRGKRKAIDPDPEKHKKRSWRTAEFFEMSDA